MLTANSELIDPFSITLITNSGVIDVNVGIHFRAINRASVQMICCKLITIIVFKFDALSELRSDNVCFVHIGMIAQKLPLWHFPQTLVPLAHYMFMWLHC